MFILRLFVLIFVFVSSPLLSIQKLIDAKIHPGPVQPFCLSGVIFIFHCWKSTFDKFLNFNPCVQIVFVWEVGIDKNRWGGGENIPVF